MRTIQFPSGTHESTKDTVGALAWATNRRGGAKNAWKSENVVRSILQYLRENNVETPDATHLSQVIRSLEVWGYAKRRMSDTGRRTVEFKFDDDVILSGHQPATRSNGSSPVPRILAPRSEAASPPPSRQVVSQGRPQFGTRPTPPPSRTVDHAIPTPALPDLPPLPFNDRELLPPLYRLDELEVELREWADTEDGAEAYATWVDAVIDQFRRKKENNP